MNQIKWIELDTLLNFIEIFIISLLELGTSSDGWTCGAQRLLRSCGHLCENFGRKEGMHDSLLLSTCPSHMNPNICSVTLR